MSDLEIHDLAGRLLGKRTEELDAEEHRVLAMIVARRPSVRDAAEVSDEQASFGARLADKVAAVGGSWSFIVAFGVILLGWMLLNTEILAHLGMAFDPYPYIFLNLMLSMLAAVQAPIILMSQNRQTQRDRIAASLDYEINLRAEIELLRVHSKLDNIVIEKLERISSNQQRLLSLFYMFPEV